MLIVIAVVSVESYVKICSLNGVISLLLISGVTLNLISAVAGVGLCAVVPDGNWKDPVPDITICPPEVTVPENVGDALVASPRLFASVKSPNVNQPLLAEFLIFNKLFAVSAQI